MSVQLQSELPVEVIGQYASDYSLNSNDPNLGKDPNEVIASRDDGNIVMHNTNLFDQEELDEAIGFIPVKTTSSETFQSYEADGILTISDAIKAEITARRLNPLDDAERWLRQHDPENTHYKKAKQAESKKI